MRTVPPIAFTPIRLPGKLMATPAEIKELMNRKRLMVIRNPVERVDPNNPTEHELYRENRHEEEMINSLVNGTLAERHLKNMFQRWWPQMYEPAPNEGKYKEGCDYDFILNGVRSKPLTVDVECANYKEMVGTGYKTPKADIYFRCTVTKDDEVVWLGAIKRDDYCIQSVKDFRRKEWGKSLCPTNICYIMNSIRDGVDWRQVSA